MATTDVDTFADFQRFLHNANKDNVSVAHWTEFLEKRDSLQRSYHRLSDVSPYSLPASSLASSPASSPAELLPDLSVMIDVNGDRWYAVHESDVDELRDQNVPCRTSTVSRITIQDERGNWWRRNAS